MLSKIQTNTRLSGRLLDQGTRSGRATTVCPRTCVRLWSTSSAYHSRSFHSRANRRIFNRLECSANFPRYLANSLRISNFYSRVNQASRLLLTNNPNPFISLRGSKELARPFSKSKTARQPTHSHSAKNQNNQTTTSGRGALSSSVQPAKNRSKQLDRSSLPSTAVTWV